MLTIKEIIDIIKVLDESSLSEFVYEKEGEKLKLKKETIKSNSPVITREVEPTTVQQVPAEQGTLIDIREEELVPAYDYEVTSPMVGTFYLSPSPESEPYISIGSRVNKSTVVCMIEAMKLFNEIEAEVDGEIVEILAQDGELVEYGQPLFGIKKA